MSGNLDFEAGNLSGWTLSTRTNVSSIPLQTCCLAPTANALVLNGGFDPNIGFNLTSPLGGNWMARLNSTSLIGLQLTTIENTISVSPSNNYLKIAAKYVLESAMHSCIGQPFVNIKVTDLTGNIILFNKFIQANELVNSGLCNGSNFNSQIFSGSNNVGYYYNSNWDIFCIDLGPLIGNSAKVEISVSECSYVGHGGYGYFDIQNSSLNNSISFNSNLYLNNSNIAICNSSTATVIAPPGALNYYWQGTGINGATTQSVLVNQPGAYSLLYTLPTLSLCSNTNSTVVNFTVGAISPINVAISSTAICDGSSVTFSLSGASTYSISSSYGYNNYSTNTTATLFPPLTTNTFYFSGFTPLGCSSTQSVSVITNPTPTISVLGNNFCSGNTGTLVATGANTYTWVEVSTSNTVSTTNSLVITPTVSTSYNVYGSNSSNGCQSFTSFATQVLITTLNTSPTLSMCAGSSLTLNAIGSPMNSYTWSTGGNMQSVVINPSVTTNYTLSGTNICGVFSFPFTVTVNPLPNVTITGPATVCPGATHTWVANGANSYTIINSATSQSVTTPVIVGSISYPFTLIAIGSDLNGCQNTASLALTLLPSPTVNVNGVQISPSFAICLGDSYTLTAGGANTYSWNTGSNSNSIVVTPTVGTCYSYSATGANGCNNYITACVAVNYITPTITTLAGNYTLCNASSINLGQSINQCCGLTYSVNNQPINNPNFYLPSSSGTHTLSVQNGCAVTQATFIVNILATPTVTILAPDSACKNSVVTITLSGATNYVYSTLSGNYNTSNSINSFSLTNSQTIMAYGSYTNGCYSAVPSPTYFIKALPPPTMTITPLSSSVCAGSPLTLSVSLSAASFSWSTGSFANAITFTPTSNTVVSVSSTGTNGCSGSISKTIAAIPIPTLTAYASPTAICIGNASNIFCNGANSYTWSNSFIGNSQTVTPTANTLYSVTGYSVNNPCPAIQTINVVVNPLPTPGFSQSQYSVCYGQTAAITVTGAANYNVGLGPICTFNVFNALNTGTYNVIGYSVANCTQVATTTLNVFPNPTVSVISVTSCAGNSATLTANGANSYTWSTGAFTNTTSVNPITTTIYTVTGATSNNCLDTQTGQVLVFFSPNLIATASPTAICMGNSIYLSASGANTYTWSNGSNSNAFNITPLAGSIYSVSGTIGNCTATKTLAIVVNSNTTTAVTSTVVCFGSSVDLYASGATTYSWSTGASTPSINVTPPVNVSYSVTGTDINGCVTATPAVSNVTVNALPILNMLTTNSLICTGQSATLTSSGANTFTWSNSSTGNNIVVSPTVNTTYTVTGTDVNGCVNFATITQSVSLCAGFDGSSLEGKNSIIIYPNPSAGIFNITCNYISENSNLEIYNSIGQLILTQKIRSKNSNVDISKYASGLYYVKFNGNEKVCKLIKE
jgi:hypothetical protein